MNVSKEVRRLCKKLVVREKSKRLFTEEALENEAFCISYKHTDFSSLGMEDKQLTTKQSVLKI